MADDGIVPVGDVERAVGAEADIDGTEGDVVAGDERGLLYGLVAAGVLFVVDDLVACLLYTSPSPRDRTRSRMPSSA